MIFPKPPSAPLVLGISECLTGSKVRYDGTDAHASLPHADLQGLFEYHSFCPEVGIGMSVPREPIRLVGTTDQYRVLGVNDPSLDLTAKLIAFGEAQKPLLQGVSGYIFMHHSPSCGLMGVKLYPEDGGLPNRQAAGVYAATITQMMPNLPVEDANRLIDADLRASFVVRAFTYAHWRLIEPRITAAQLVAFHSKNKCLLMAHSQTAYRTVGLLVADLKENVPEKAQRYISLLMSALKIPATRQSHANVLSHLQGYLKIKLDSSSKVELDKLIRAYRKGEKPLLAPLAMLNDHFRVFPDEYVQNQSYLELYTISAS